jgi:ketosteroid isomerase-like protein
MSRDNVETVWRVHRAWEADDLEAFLAELHSDCEWHGSIERAVEGQATVYHGHEGARRAWTEYRSEAFGRLAAEIAEVRDLGDTVLLLGRFVVTGRTTLIEFGSELGQIFTFRDGKIASSHDYMSHP